MGIATTRSVPSPQVLVPWWRRPFVRPVRTTAPPLQRIVRDLARLEAEAERLLTDDSILARGQRLMAVRAAFDMALRDAAAAVGVPVPPGRGPLSREDRFMTTVELTRAGLHW